MLKIVRFLIEGSDHIQSEVGSVTIVEHSSHNHGPNTKPGVALYGQLSGHTLFSVQTSIFSNKFHYTLADPRLTYSVFLISFFLLIYAMTKKSTNHHIYVTLQP